MILQIHKILPKTRANGPGIRFGIWFQGCTLGCLGCSNFRTHNPNHGEELEVQLILDQIELVRNSLEGISISGGEPFQQSKGLLELANEITIRFPELSIIMWSGYEMAELVEVNEFDQISKNVDLIITGRYEKEQRNPQGLKGSENQKYLFLSDRYSENDIQNTPQMEILFTESGIELTGINTRLIKTQRW